MTNKYAEGYPGKRYYGGCEFVDVAENLARTGPRSCSVRIRQRPAASGSQANMAVYLTFFQPGDTVLGMDLAHGGHLTHGSPVNFSGTDSTISFRTGWSRTDGHDRLRRGRRQALAHKPKLIVTGAQRLSRKIDFAKFREIADQVGAFLMADIAHPAGLVATGLHPDPLPHCDVVTTTTHKTLRGSARRA